MKVIVAGGSGLIGRALANKLAERGDDVIVLSRTPDRTGTFSPAVRVAAWDGKSAKNWGELVDADTAIVNLAGAGIADSRWTDARKRELRESRLAAGRAIAAAVELASAKPRVLVQSSAVGYYGPRGTENVTEASDPGTDFLARLCVDWENGTAGVEAAGVRRTVIRTGIVLSRTGGALPRMMLPFRLFTGGPLGTGRQGFPWIHLADEVGAILFLIDHPSAAGAFNLSAPGVVTNAEFAHELGRAMSRPSLIPTPSFALQIVFGEMATALLDGQRAVPSRLLELGYEFQFRTARSALADLFGNRREAG